MTYRSLLVIPLLLMLGTLAHASNAAAPELSLAQRVGQLPDIRQAALSPSGKQLMLLRAIGDTYQVTVTDLTNKSSKIVMASDPDNFQFFECQWANETRLVCTIFSYGEIKSHVRNYLETRTVFSRLLAINADGSDFVQLVPYSRSKAVRDLLYNPIDQSNIISWLPHDHDHVLIQLARDDLRQPSVYRLNIYKNKLKRERKFHSTVSQWYADSKGELRLAAGARQSGWAGFTIDKGHPRELNLSHLARGSFPTVVHIPAAEDFAYVTGNNQTRTRALHKIRLSDGSVQSTVIEDADYDLYGDPIISSDDKLQGLPILREGLEYVWLDKKLEAKMARLRTQLPGKPSKVWLASKDATDHMLVVRASGGTLVPTWYLYDSVNPSLVILGQDLPKLDQATPLHAISYKSRDGAKIPGYLALPNNLNVENAKKLPTIILPHGGPYVRDTKATDYWVELLVRRGYAVLKPNFRGSTGYGFEHFRLGQRQWGLRMQDDVIDGLDWMISEGITDPERVCIVGGSYGGYVALVAAYKTPERFKCAVSFAGVADLKDLADRAWLYRFGQLRRGWIQKGKSVVENSPLHHVESIKVPLLIVHGDVDRSVMIEQSRNFVEALDAAGKPHTYIEQSNGDHFLSRQSQRIEFLEALDSFLTEHL